MSLSLAEELQKLEVENQIEMQKYKLDSQLQSASAKNQMAFQERMSNTAHQREVKDLIAAGLNPVLSSGGNGASTPQGAEGDISGAQIANLLESSIATNAKAVQTLGYAFSNREKTERKRSDNAAKQSENLYSPSEGPIDPTYLIHLNDKGNTFGIPNSAVNSITNQALKGLKWADDLIDKKLPGYVDAKNKLISIYGAPANAYEKVMQNAGALIGTAINNLSGSGKKIAGYYKGIDKKTAKQSKKALKRMYYYSSVTSKPPKGYKTNVYYSNYKGGTTR